MLIFYIDNVKIIDNKYLHMDRGSSYPAKERYIWGTGFIVGDHQIATAAHVVYEGNWFKPITICNYKYNGEQYGSNMFTPVEVHIPNDYDPDVSAPFSTVWDYALITVEEDLSGFVQFDLGTSYSVNADNFNNIPIYVTGCPDITNTGSQNTSDRLYTGEGKIVKKIEIDYNGTTYIPPAPNTIMLCYNTDTSYGTSGGPVYTVTKNNVNGNASFTYTALAVNSSGSVEYYDPNGVNFGSLITKYLIQFYIDNSYVNY